MSAIHWLASYPKSGSTWFRMLIANLGQEVPADINALAERTMMASARGQFDNLMLFPSGLLTHEECDRLRPVVHAAVAAGGAMPDLADAEDSPTRIGDTRFVKTHDAWTVLADGTPLLAGADGARAAILIVRDPRDVAVSLAHHNGQTIDQAIAFMNRADASLCGMRDRQQNQLRQQLPGWSGFNAGWLEQGDIPVHLVRYEDMQRDAAAVLAETLAFAGIATVPDEVARAAAFARFDALKAQENERGFREAPNPRDSGRFFRRGVAEGWRDELSEAQVGAIEAAHGAMMARLGYAPADGKERNVA